MTPKLHWLISLKIYFKSSLSCWNKAVNWSWEWAVSEQGGDICSSSAQVCVGPCEELTEQPGVCWKADVQVRGCARSFWWGRRRAQGSGEKPLSYEWQRKEKPAPRHPSASTTDLFFMTPCFIVPGWWAVPLRFICQLSRTRIFCFRKHFTSVSHQEFFAFTGSFAGFQDKIKFLN